ncbi:MarR family transcriptional regulator [Deinococcus sp. SL84]|uniref:MarR family transcriptional regulator n=1 Tax=Deinococcus sp. SL84 TaxID=2994663 RepID=UPI002275DA30|nr:MarR family transcriptional regulator [Deinococcus sp. SL84]MCY1703815.1 MarR family transcriptional regulator [Deinococcus sp. SL84]
MLLRIRAGDFGQPTVRELAEEFQVSKDTVQRLLDQLEFRGLITKAPSKGISATGQLAYQGHLNLNPGLLSVEITNSVRAEQAYWPQKVHLIERLLHADKAVCFERQWFAPHIHINNADLGDLRKLQLESFVHKHGVGLMDTHTQVSAHPMPSSMAHLLNLHPQPVLTQHIQRYSSDTLVWVTERFFVPGHQLETRYLS